MVMSNENLSIADVSDRVRRFWNLLRASGAGPDAVFGAVLAMFFLKGKKGDTLDYLLEEGVLEAEIFNLEESSQYEKALYEKSFRNLLAYRGGISGDSLWSPTRELHALVADLDLIKFWQIAGRILDEIPSWSRLGDDIYLLPREVAQFMVESVFRTQKGSRDLFVPFVPHPSIIEMAPDMTFCQVPSRAAHTCIGLYHTVFGRRARIRVENSENVWNSFGQQFDRVVAAPPFRGRLSRLRPGFPDVESYCVEQVANMLGPNGTAAICVTPAFLFRPSTSVRELRARLLEEGMVESVVQLPGKLYKLNSLAPVILLLRGERKAGSSVRVIDATDCVRETSGTTLLDLNELNRRLNEDVGQKVRNVTLKELRDTDFDLSPARHLKSEVVEIPPGHELYRVGDLLSPVQGHRANSGDRGVYLSRRTFPDSTPRFASSFESNPEVYVEEIEGPRTLRRISSDCLLVDPLAFHGEHRTLWFVHSGKDLLVSPDILVFEVRPDRVDRVEGRWIPLALRSEAVSRQIKFFLAGGVIPRLRTELFKNLEVAVPLTKPQQLALVSSAEELQRKASAKEIGLESLLDEQREALLRDVRLKKHTLAQIANDIKSSVEYFTKLLERKSAIETDEIIGSHHPVSAVDYMRRIAKRCVDLGTTLESLTQDSKFRTPESLDLEAAFEKLQDRCRGREFEAKVMIDKDSFIDPVSGESIRPIIQIAADDFDDLCENIIENALRHGFQNSDRKRLIQIEAVCHGEEQKIEVNIKNTGRPLPEGLSTERFGTRGEKAGLYANTGTGGYHIKALMDHVQGSVEIRNLIDGFFTVEVKLSFPFQT